MKLITYYIFFFKKNIPYLVEYKMEESNNKGFLFLFLFYVLYIIEWIVVSIILLKKKKS